MPARELFTGRYRSRTLLLLGVCVLGYPGIVYGATAYIPTYLVEHQWTPHEIFLWGGGGSIAAVPVIIIVFYAVSCLGERFERKNIILITGLLFTATAAHGNYGWILWCALLPSLLIGWLGIRQRGAILEQIST